MKYIIAVVLKALLDVRELLAYALPGVGMAWSTQRLFCDYRSLAGWATLIVSGGALIAACWALSSWQRNRNKEIANRCLDPGYHDRLKMLNKRYREIQKLAVSGSLVATGFIIMAFILRNAMLANNLGTGMSLGVGLVVGAAGAIFAATYIWDMATEGNRPEKILYLTLVVQIIAVAYPLWHLCPM